ncbi:MULTISPECIES: hypothetical protein [unclassified Vibrio]|uniref:hypothetical protein n=1 Tax=unclassified Vibrio TaxID=2614977 RepID=UPI0011109321|nr:hypothetical protein [Vibrio sp. Hep-1b-8]TMX35207.1 hypothetical protein DA100_14345 [Vibrio sp. Hep-1b-8]
MKYITLLLLVMLNSTFSYAIDDFYLIRDVEVELSGDTIKVSSELGGSINCEGENGVGAWILKSNSEVYDMAKSLILSAFIAEIPVMIDSSCDEEGIRVIDNIIATKRE